MTAMKLPTYSLQLRGARFYDVYFRVNGRQVKRRVGRAWVKDGKPRRGRPQEGFLDVAAAHDRAREIVAEHVATVAEPRSVGPTFRNVAREYMTWLAKVRGAKPSTLADHGYALAEPNGTTNGSVMRALGDRPAAEVTAAEIEALLDTLAESGARARTINKRRALLLAVFNYGMRRCGLPGNPVRGTDTRREPQRPALETYTVAEVEQLAAALADGRHRGRGAAINDAERAEDCQDAELVRVAAYTGLRQGELRALRWRDVGTDVLTVSRALSAGVESGTKGGRVRHVPLVPQASAALERLHARGDFAAREELVFCNWRGRALDPSALVARFKRARDAAGLRALRFHDLRHTYGSLLAAAGVPVTDIQSAMGHADLQTTARYLHARQASEQVDRFARAFAGVED
ncbi:MAG: site-specific integrase [Actinobacteria bacterium]|nr:MAG: site-specific integrase [Actinomycetota bacterium]